MSKLSALAAERYISWTTFKRDGTAVSTPVVKRSLDAFNALVRTLARRPPPQAEYIEIVPHATT